MTERLNRDTFVKIFQGFGRHGADDIEEQVNDFINNGDPVHVISLTPQMCTVGGHEEMFQAMTVTVWYRYVGDCEIEASA